MEKLTFIKNWLLLFVGISFLLTYAGYIIISTFYYIILADHWPIWQQLKASGAIIALGVGAILLITLMQIGLEGLHIALKKLLP